MERGNISIRNVHLPYRDAQQAAKLYDVFCKDSRVHATASSDENRPSPAWQDSDLDAGGKGILLPALCHAHIHLDKCFLLEKCEPLVTGDFVEALRVTAEAKDHFPHELEDLYLRGRRLVLASIEAGVNLIRAHVEVDATVLDHCLRTGLQLKKEFAHLCEIQIAVFAQDPLFHEPTDDANSNFAHLRNAIRHEGVDVVGSAPYVESSVDLAKQNIRSILDLAFEYGKQADFHLDYNLDASQEPLIWYLLDEMIQRVALNRWNPKSHICVGHATRLTLFNADEWRKFKHLVEANHLPISLAGLPQSDLYMMGRTLNPVPRGTLNVVQLALEYGIRAAMAVNNVDNAFTPQGPPDPLALCPLGVAVFQAGTVAHAHALIEAITVNARQAVGQEGTASSRSTIETLVPQVGDAADFVLLETNTSLQSVVCDPSYDRVTIQAGRIVARRNSQRWFLGA